MDQLVIDKIEQTVRDFAQLPGLLTQDLLNGKNVAEDVEAAQGLLNTLQEQMSVFKAAGFDTGRWTTTLGAIGEFLVTARKVPHLEKPVFQKPVVQLGGLSVVDTMKRFLFGGSSPKTWGHRHRIGETPCTDAKFGVRSSSRLDPKSHWLTKVKQYAISCGVNLTDSDLRGIAPLYNRNLTPEDAVHVYTEECNLSSGDGLYGDDYTG